MKRMLILLSLSAAALPMFAATIPAKEARQHVGEHATVCGPVASGHYAPSSKGQPTFLHFDEPYPNEDFTVLIWGEDRAKFGTPETSLQGQRAPRASSRAIKASPR